MVQTRRQRSGLVVFKHISALACLGVLGSCSAPPRPAGDFRHTREELNTLATPLRPIPATPSTPPVPQNPGHTYAHALGGHDPDLVERDIPKTVRPGQTVFFGLDVVDDDADVLRIELVEKPEGVSLDPRTLTVRWTVPARATGAQSFKVKITERPGESTEHVVDESFQVQVQPQAPRTGAARQAPASRPTPSDLLVSSLVTITNPAVLAGVQREWPITRLMEIGRDGAILGKPADVQPSVHKPTGDEMFRELLKGYAQLHQNPRLDPDAATFDPRFAATKWRLVAVRPRLNRHLQELRLAYQATEVPEPNFLMFRVRFFTGVFPSTPELGELNNKAFTKLFYEAFFQASRLKPGIAEARVPQVSAAVAGFVRRVLTYRDPQSPDSHAAVAAIAEEARMGGGSVFDDEGGYVSGNAWAFTVHKFDVEEPHESMMGPVDRDFRTVAVNIGPLSGFTFDIAPNQDGTEWVAQCPPKYHDGHPDNEPGMSALCLQDGTVRMGDKWDDARWHWARRDSLNEHFELAFEEQLERVSLRDPRRRNMEEFGMTCVQCHMRNFDDGVMSETQVLDPRVRTPITPPREVERVPQQILPIGGVARAPWFVQQETNQLCDIRRDIAKAYRVDVTALPCPDGY